MKRGKTIKLYISNDEMKNLKIAELSNWVGKAIIGNRRHIDIIRKIDDFFVPGIYLLILDEYTSFQKKVYIGEADDVSERIFSHSRNNEKEWWDKFIFFISKDSNLTKSHVRYLEKEIYNIAKDNITTIDLANKQEPTGSKLPQSEIDDMEDFKENIFFVLKQLGIIDLANIKNNNDTEFSKDNIEESPVFYLKIKNKNAKLKIIGDTYRLLAGSFVKKEGVESFKSHNYSKLRKELEEKKYFDIGEDKDFFILKSDVDFKSPSAAAAIVRNSSVNGRRDWKLENNITLGEYESM